MLNLLLMKHNSSFCIVSLVNDTADRVGVLLAQLRSDPDCMSLLPSIVGAPMFTSGGADGVITFATDI
jgi:hypothetical protein